MVSDILSSVKAALDSGKTDDTKTEDPPPTALETETDFKKRYKQHTGTDLHEQYRPVNMGTAENPKWQNSLVYKMQDRDGNEYNYVPAIHGVEHAFESNDHISQIPSVHHVNGGPNQGPVQPSAPVDLGQNDPRINPAVADAAVQGLQAGAMPGVAAPQVVPQGAVDAAVDGMQVGAPSTIPDTPIDPGGWETDPQTGEKIFTPSTETGQLAIPGSPAPGSLDKPADPSELIRDEKGEVDYAATIAKLVSEHQPSKLLSEADKIRTAAAGKARDIVNPKVGGTGIAALALTALLAGKHGGEVLAGGVKGIKDATATRQAQSDSAWQAAQAQAAMQAKALDEQGKAEEDAFKLKLQTYLGLNKSEADKYYKEAQINLKKEAQRQSGTRIAEKADSDFWSNISKLKMGPAREQYALAHGMDPDDAAQLGKASPNELLSMAGATLKNQQAQNAAAYEPIREALGKSRTEVNWGVVGYNQVKAAGQQLLNDMETMKVANYPKEEKLKLEKMSKDIEKENTDVERIQAQIANGTLGKSSVRGLSETAFATQFGAYDRAIGAAEKIKKQFGIIADGLTKEKDSLPGKIKEQEKILASNPSDEQKALATQSLMKLRSRSIKIEGDLLKATAQSQAQDALIGRYQPTLDALKQARTEKAEASTAGTGAWKAQPAASDINYLRAHPETKDRFVARFGRLP